MGKLHLTLWVTSESYCNKYKDGLQVHYTALMVMSFSTNVVIFYISF